MTFQIKEPRKFPLIPDDIYFVTITDAKIEKNQWGNLQLRLALVIDQSLEGKTDFKGSNLRAYFSATDSRLPKLYQDLTGQEVKVGDTIDELKLVGKAARVVTEQRKSQAGKEYAKVISIQAKEKIIVKSPKVTDSTAFIPENEDLYSENDLSEF
ncbi:MAG: hypothetical protein AB1414_01190 [bacterium]